MDEPLGDSGRAAAPPTESPTTKGEQAGGRTQLDPLWAAGFAVLLVAYAVRVGISPLEVVRLLAGATLLWAPFCLAIDAWVSKEVNDGACRLALAFAGSYALTSTAYFLCSMAGIPSVLYAIQAAAVAGTILYRMHTGRVLRPSLASIRPNWFLLCLIALALLTTAPYTRLAEVEASGTRNVYLPVDSLYYASQSYEIARHLPPEEEPLRAGSPARAYHLLPHTTTVLLARASGQPDLLRAQLVEHLTILTSGVSMLLYALGKALSRRRLGGYVLVALLYPLAVFSPRLLPLTAINGNIFIEFYVTPFNQLSSMLDRVALSSWQTYSALVVVLGLLLAVATMSPRLTSGLPFSHLLSYAAAMTAVLVRFRAQAFMVALPAFLLVAASCYLRTRRRSTIISLGPLLLTVPLLIEMRSRRYLSGSSTSAIKLGYNGLTKDWGFIFSSWPLSRSVYAFMDGILDGSTLKWAWQIVCISIFTVLGVVGFLTTLSLICYLYRRSSWTAFRPFTLLVLTMAAGSLVIGLFVAAGDDSYSVAGETLFMTVWYLFPLVAVTAKQAYSFIQPRLRLSSMTWSVVGMLIVLAGSWARWAGPGSIAVYYEYHARIAAGGQLSEDRWDAIQWLRVHTPSDAVIMSKTYSSGQLYFSGLAGRAGYFEWSSVIHNSEDQRTYVADRMRLVENLWSTSQASDVCSLLKKTPATYLVEFAMEPLTITSAPCLSLAWTSPYQEAKVWKVINR